jgi:hypothetical protein
VSGICIAVTSGCRPPADSEVVKETIGAGGGVITSADSVLSIVVRPNALEQDTEVSIERTDEPPDVFGPAYRVRPNVELAVPSTLTYRHELPADATEVAIGYVDPEEYAADMGRWHPLPVLDIDEADGFVKGTDDRLSTFYALLAEGGAGPIGTTGTAGGSEDTGSPTDGPEPTSAADDPTNDGNDDDPTNETDTGEADTGETTGGPGACDAIFRGPYTVEQFSDITLVNAEDLSFDGRGAFVARSGTDLVSVDPEGNVDVLIPDVPSFLGVRHAPDGRIIAAGNETMQILEFTPGGDVNVLLGEMLSLPNAVFPDRNGYIWVSDFFGNFIGRIDDDGANPTLIVGAPEAVEANGVHFDPDRSALFFSTYGPGDVYRVQIDGNFMPQGDPVLLTHFDGAALDGLTLDECGNLYVVDNNYNAQGRLIRLFLDEGGDMIGEPEIIVDAGGFPSAVANAQFATGAGWAEYATHVFVTGLPGVIFHVDLQIGGGENAVWP